MVNTVIGAEIFSVMMCIVIYIANIFTSASEKPKNTSSKWFGALVSSCIFYTVSDLITYLIDAFSALEKMLVVYNIFAILSFIGGFVLTILFLQYVRALIRNKDRKLSKDLNRISTFSTFLVLITIIQFIANNGFHSDLPTQEGAYSDIIPLYDISNAIILLLSYIIFLKCRKLFSKTQYYTLMLFLIFPSLAALIQIFFTKLSFGYAASSMSMLVIFIVIQSERITLNQKLEIERVTFRDAIMKNAAMYVVTDVTEEMITEDIIDANGNSVLEALGFSVPAPFDEEAKAFFKNNKVTFLSEDAKKCFSCAGLKSMYEEGTTVDSIEICLGEQGEETYLRMMPLLSVDPYTKHLMCTCPCIDITAQKKKELEIQNKLSISQQNEEQLTEAINSIACIYDTMHLIDIENNIFTEFGASDEVQNVISENKKDQKNIQYLIWSVMKERIPPEYQKDIKDFTNFSTLNARMKDKLEISVELFNIHEKWFRFSFIRMGCPEDDVTRVIFVSQNIDEQKREKEKLKKKSVIDELTDCLNRNAYEDALAEIQDNFKDKQFVIVSADLNGLKVVNDNLGHAAGDELIIGAAECMQKCFRKYGRVYRIGGDEYAAILDIDHKKMPKLIEEFKDITGAWTGNIADSLTMSIGYAAGAEFPDENIFELIKIADRKMYEAKANYYKQKGVDRRGQQRALNAIVHTYTRILKVDLDNDTVEELRAEKSKKIEENQSNVFSERVQLFIKNGNVYEEDIQEFLKHINIDYIREFFRNDENEMYFQYRRKIGDEFKHVLMEVIPTDDFSPEKQEVYLYIKDIEAMQ